MQYNACRMHLRKGPHNWKFLLQRSLNKRHLTSNIPNLLDIQTGCIKKGFELIWCSLDTIYRGHHGNIATVAESCVITIVSGQWRRGRFQLGTAKCSVHHLLDYQEARIGGHAVLDTLENIDRVIVGPVVAVGNGYHPVLWVL